MTYGQLFAPSVYFSCTVGATRSVVGRRAHASSRREHTMSQWSASLLATRAGASWAQLDPEAHLGGSHLAEDPMSRAKDGPGRLAARTCWSSAVPEGGVVVPAPRDWSRTLSTTGGRSGTHRVGWVKVTRVGRRGGRARERRGSGQRVVSGLCDCSGLGGWERGGWRDDEVGALRPRPQRACLGDVLRPRKGQVPAQG